MLSIYTVFKFGTSNEPFQLADSYGDCDESETIFSIIRHDPALAGHLRVDRFNFSFHGKGECSGLSETSCTLDRLGSYELNLNDFTVNRISGEENNDRHLFSKNGSLDCAQTALDAFLKKVISSL